MLTIYGVARSRASRIIWLCHEIGIEFRHEPVIQAYRLPDPGATDAPLNTRSPGFLKMSPAGSIPVIDDDGLILSESMACTLYLARKYGMPFGPGNAGEEAQMSQWSFYATAAIEPDTLTLLFLHEAGKDDGGAVAKAAERLIRPLQVVEGHLAANSFITGQRFTVADINMAEVLRYAQAHTALIEQFPAIAAWLADCQSRPAFRRMWEARLAEPE
ncbi:glutathione S-transferase family protein [Paracoccus sp. (in: a-proteobacteria)]|uniref:glutathione S-transferase family protein n=1 Tax=Paracoccus sp. TaxID=267 RepID=UPI003A8A424C